MIEEFEFAVNVSFALLVVLQVPKSIVKEPAPTVDPELLYAPVTNVCELASEDTTKEASMFSVPVVPVVVNLAIVVLLEDPT